MLTRKNIMKPNTVVYARTTNGVDQLIEWAKREDILCSRMIEYYNYIKDNENNLLCYCVMDGRVLGIEYCENNDYDVISLDGENNYISSKLIFSIIGIIVILAIIYRDGVA